MASSTWEVEHQKTSATHQVLLDRVGEVPDLQSSWPLFFSALRANSVLRVVHPIKCAFFLGCTSRAAHLASWARHIAHVWEKAPIKGAASPVEWHGQVAMRFTFSLLEKMTAAGADGETSSVHDVLGRKSLRASSLYSGEDVRRIS